MNTLGGNIQEGDDQLSEVIARLQSLFTRKDDKRMVVVDIDADAEDPSMCAEIFKNLRSMEMEIRPMANYMEIVQTNIDSKSRAKCVDDIIKAAEELRRPAATLHLAVNCLDRHLSVQNIENKNMFPIALACLMIADKFDGVNTEFDIHAYTRIFAGKVSAPEFMRMEIDILNQLKFDVSVPTAYTFLERFVRAAQGGREVPLQSLGSMAAYVAEMSLLSTQILRFSPSMVAASSVFLALYFLDPDEKAWNGTLKHYTMYEASDLHECVTELHEWGYRNCLPEITAKYRKKEYDNVAWKMTPPPVPVHMFRSDDDIKYYSYGW